ncbi:alkaline phosphatase [Pragia fontium]|uniref:Alkaline phosphatase n=1 Tax=Pragia fontium DSM 5563 = ATCC 49100 TaxID=1122977 RepID=A0AAJ4WAX5_9GAMM|nr:alkaline phosphatase [Pragia fontium]SFC89381.1 alkaline phosphatase [Pragia fontium DSM 5563 = ATCC 49100]VEJ56007.1 Alkaline phosphatase precursor [Pragia fontium]
MKASWFIPMTLALVPVLVPVTASAVNIYPIDRATMLTGGKFDFKVEFEQEVNPEKVSVKINGKDYQQVWGKKSEFIKNEDGAKASSLVVKNVDLTSPGAYKVEVSAGDEKGSVSWNIYQTPAKRQAKNVILFIGDGLSVAHRTGARILSKGITEGKADGRLAMDDLSNMAFIGTSSTDSIAADSANTMSAYMTGHKSGVNALGVYVSRAKDSLNHPKQETLGELLKRTTNMSVGIVSDAELEDATPAAVVSHTRRRADKSEIVSMFYDVKPEVMLGGGSAYFLPQTTPGSKRKDDQNYIERFQQAGYQLATDADSLKQQGASASKLLGLFHTGNMDDVLDRRFLKNDVTKKFPNQPDLTEMTQTALDVLSKNDNGFFLMVESALIDKASHPLDWERSIYNTIMLDQSVAVAKKFAETHPDTLIIVTGDHTHGISIIGTVDDNKPGSDMREKVGVYETAGYPNYQDKNGDGYPDKVDVSKRLAVFFNNFPDYYETFRPKLDGRFVPAIQNEKGEYIANAAYKDVPGAVLRTGNIPRDADTGVHSVDDMIVQASGPGSERIRGYMDNTELFRVITDALSLGHGKQGQ